jgi:hypothetical protein
MITVRRFDADDLSQLKLQPMQAADWLEGQELIERGRVFALGNHCYSFVNDDDVVIAAAGLLPNHDNCMTAWALLSALSTPDFLYVTRWLRAYLDNLPCRRFDMMVRGGFANAHQWARLLRFTHEGVQRAWFPDGNDMHVYARVREVVSCT